MALLAVLPELPLVSIVLLVAGDTIRRRRYHFTHRLIVAGLALDPRVRPFKLVFRLRIVVELPELPPVGIMAIRALGPQPFLVNVLFGMTGITIDLGIFKSHGLVTLTTGKDRVLADQRKTAQVMIELNAFLPPRFVMAHLAINTDLPLMHIPRLVAGVTDFINFHVQGRRFMASITLGLAMPARQLEMRIAIMVERHFLPVILGMAGRAFNTVLFFMHIINLMAVNALRSCLNGEQVRFMASGAGRLNMRAFQRILGSRIMQKGDLFPILRIMTAFTALFLRAGVDIVDHMAGLAVERRILIRLVGMTGIASHLLMLARQ